MIRLTALRLPPVPARLYRHFAMATLALTAIIAFFAEGPDKHEEWRAATDVDLPDAPPPELAASREISDAMFMQSRNIRARHIDDRDSASDSTGFGQPTLRTPVNRRGSSTPAPAASAGLLSPEMLATLTPEEQERLLEDMRRNGISTQRDIASLQRRLMEQSSRRSGGTLPGNRPL